MNSVVKKIRENSANIIEDNNFLFAAFQNRLLSRIIHIFEKYKITVNKDMIKKNLEENFINNLYDQNELIIDRYIKMIGNYETIIWKYVEEKSSVDLIKKATMSFVSKLKEKNNEMITKDSANNFKEYIGSIIMVYDNFELNNEMFTRIESDTFEIINEFNRNNYNFVIESINEVIKNIIKNI